MNVTDFCSEGRYIYLPSQNDPKVVLAVDSAFIAHNTFKLYNPFSKQAKLLKMVVKSLFFYAHPLAKHLFGVEIKEKSIFLAYLEEKLNKPLISSIYIATAKDKVILQLQSITAEIIGYIKYPLNSIGIKHLENEKKAIEILSEKKIVPDYYLYDAFEGKPFLFLPSIEGKIGIVGRKAIDELLQKMERKGSYCLSAHPRIISLQHRLRSNGMLRYNSIVQSLCQKSTYNYALVYEHGDFAPWNIIKRGEEYIPFDFENFVEDGLEHFDIIKYYFQIGKLLEKKRGEVLISYIIRKVNIPEVLEMLQLFLIKEIVRYYEANEPFDVECELLERLEKR